MTLDLESLNILNQLDGNPNKNMVLYIQLKCLSGCSLMPFTWLFFLHYSCGIIFPSLIHLNVLDLSVTHSKSVLLYIDVNIA